MDVADADLDGRHVQITIGQYLALEPAQRPGELTCAGTAAGQPCNGPVFPKAIHGGPIAPHFASRAHADGCDHAAHRSTSLTETDTSTDTAASRVLQLTGTPSGVTGDSDRRQRSPAGTATAPRASLRTVLRALTGAGLPQELVVRWHQQRPLLAYEFFIHLASAITERDQDRGYWGAINTVHQHDQTGSLHLIPKVGARIVVDAQTSLALSSEPATGLADLVPGSTVLAVGALHRARSGRLYVLVNQPSAIAWI